MKKLLSILLVSISLMGWSQERVLFDELSDENYDLFGVMMYENDLFNGVSIEKDEDGTIEQHYINGKKDGLRKWWDENGQLREETNYIDGKRDGIHKSWYENGQLQFEGNHIDGKRDGIHKHWYENGQLEHEGEFKDNKREGLTKEYDEDGQLRFEGNYKEHKPDGLCKVYHENGRLKFKGIFEYGKVISEKCWNEEGKEIDCEQNE